MWFREHRRVPDRLIDVLPWAALVAPDVVLNKDGSFQSTIRYRGPDLDSSTDEELVVKSVQLNNILKRFGAGWAVYAEASRKRVSEYPSSNFPEPVSALIDMQRQLAFSESPHFESSYYLTLMYLPPGESTRQVTAMFISRDNENEVSYEKYLENFRTTIQQVSDLLIRIFPEVELLREGSLLTYLHSTISEKDHPVKLPEIPMYIDSLLADSPLLGGWYPQLGSHYLGVIGFMGFPGTSQPGLLDYINHLAIEYRWVSRFVCLDKHQAKKLVSGYQRKWFASRKNAWTTLRELMIKEESVLSDPEAMQKFNDAKEAQEEIGTDEVRFGFLTTVFVIKDTDQERLRSQMTEVERIVNGLGFVTKRETVNAVDAWLGSVPGNARNNVRMPPMNTMNMAHLMPGASAAWGGPKKNSHLNGPALLTAETGGATPFRFSLHVGDVGHTLVLGPIGAGKSTLLNLIEAQFLRYPGAQVYIFDKGGSALPLTTGVGGNYYDLGAPKNELFFQPLGTVDNEIDKKWAHDWLVAIAHQENVLITPEIKHFIWDALTALATTPKEQRTMQALTVYLQDTNLRKAFQPYTKNGPYGQLFDNRKDTLTYSTWQCFEMERLMGTPKVVAPVLSYLFHRFEQRFTGAPTLVAIDEAWLFLDHPVFAPKLREWLKTLRKKNVSVLFATQSLVDVDASSIVSTIKEACFTKIYLPNAIALQPDQREFYKKFGLNSTQTEILAYAIQKQDYYYTSPLGNRLFSLNMDPVSLAYCGAADSDSQSLIHELKQSSSSVDEFNRKYLAAKNLPNFSAMFEKAKEAA